MARRSKSIHKPPPALDDAVEPAPPLPSWRRHAVPLLVLWAFTLLAYANSFRAGLVFDNRIAIAQDARVHQATSENIRLILTQDYWYKSSLSGLYRPFTTLSYMFNYALLGNGASPAGYHWINFLLHAVNVALVYRLGWLLLAEFWPAFAVAALWGVHPVLTESVTNIVGRADLLAAFGVLAGLLCYAGSVAARGRRAMLWRVALASAVMIGIFSKESAVVVLGVVFLYDVAYCRTAPRRTRAWGFLAAAAPVAVYLLARSAVLSKLAVADLAYTDNPLAGAGFLTSRLTAVKVLGKYLWLLVWPSRLSCDYSFNQIPLLTWRFDNWEDWKAVLALLVCAGAALVALVCYRRSKPVFFFIFFFFIALAPTANLAILIGTIMAERLLYLPSIGLAGCAVWAGWEAYRRFPHARAWVPAAAAVVCLAFAVRTFARNSDWFDERSLWKSAAQSSPASYRVHEHLASVLINSPNGAASQEARLEIERSMVVLEPLPDELRVPAVYAVAGFVYRAQGDNRKSLAVLLEGQRADLAWYRELSRRNRLRGSTVGLTGWVPLYLELGRTYRGMGDFPRALEALAYGQQIDPQTAFFEEFAVTYSAMGDPARAAIALLEGVAMGSPDQVRLAAEVIDLYRHTASQSCALAGSGDSTSLNFNCPLVHDQLCLAVQSASALYRRMHRDSEALATAGGAVRSLGCPADLFR